MKYPRHIQERIIQLNSTILQSLKKMDLINKKLLLVFDKDQFVGVLSIGDIQKAIIANITLNSSIHNIMRSEFIYSNTIDDKDSVLKLMKDHRIECMPILDQNKQLESIYLWDDVFNNKKRSDGIKLNLPVIIMAGGEGTRLKPLTNVLPKPLIPINEKTILEIIMDKFCDVGCNEFFLSVNYKAEMIKYYLSSLKNDNYQISYIQEEKPLGTAGSLYLLKDKIDTTFIVSNCDIIIDQDIMDIIEFHKSNKNEITVVAALKHYHIPYGILETTQNGRLQNITEKPELTFKINTGLYILEPHLINEIPEDEFYHITYLIEKLQKDGRAIGVFPISEKSWVDIGDWSEYQKFTK
jgi:dTDP-glucose pyrophosphorylase